MKAKIWGSKFYFFLVEPLVKILCCLKRGGQNSIFFPSALKKGGQNCGAYQPTSLKGCPPPGLWPLWVINYSYNFVEIDKSCILYVFVIITSLLRQNDVATSNLDVSLMEKSLNFAIGITLARYMGKSMHFTPTCTVYTDLHSTNQVYRLLPVKLLSSECQRTPSMRIQRWFR